MTEEADLQTELHNQIAPEVVNAILSPMTEFGGDPSDVMVLIETIVAACILGMCRGDLEKTKTILDCLRDGVARRCEEMKLQGEVAGHA